MIYAIGDVHGEYWRLVKLLAAMPLEPLDRIVFVGDLIDRGPSSREVIDLCIDLAERRPNTVFLRGNHEQMMLDARNHPRSFDLVSLWMGNGGAETVDSYPRTGSGWIERIPDAHWSFVERTAMEYWEDGYAFVHAGLLPPGVPWPHDEDPRLWIREPFLLSAHDFGAKVIFGHTPQRSGKPLILPNKIGIDTAVAFGGPLTGVALSSTSEPQFYQA